MRRRIEIDEIAIDFADFEEGRGPRDPSFFSWFTQTIFSFFGKKSGSDIVREHEYLSKIPRDIWQHMISNQYLGVQEIYALMGVNRKIRGTVKAALNVLRLEKPIETIEKKLSYDRWYYGIVDLFLFILCGSSGFAAAGYFFDESYKTSQMALVKSIENEYSSLISAGNNSNFFVQIFPANLCAGSSQNFTVLGKTYFYWPEKCKIKGLNAIPFSYNILPVVSNMAIYFLGKRFLSCSNETQFKRKIAYFTAIVVIIFLKLDYAYNISDQLSEIVLNTSKTDLCCLIEGLINNDLRSLVQNLTGVGSAPLRNLKNLLEENLSEPLLSLSPISSSVLSLVVPFCATLWNYKAKKDFRQRVENEKLFDLEEGTDKHLKRA